jgi:hypothetical protein
MGVSKNHHYIPQVLIRNFTNSDGKIYTYFKNRNEIINEIPKDIYFEKNRNIVYIDGKKDDFIEKLYGKTEQMIRPYFKKIISNYDKNNNIGNLPLEENDALHVLMFIYCLIWRLPIFDNYFNSFINKINLIDENNNIMISKINIKEKTCGSMYKLLKSVTDFGEYILNNNLLKNVYISYNDYSRSPHLLSDFPITLNNETSVIMDNYGLNIFNSDFIFNISSNISIIYSGNINKMILNAESIVFGDVLLMIQSTNIVCCENEDYLKAIIECSKKYSQSERDIIFIKKNIFG